MNLLVVANPIAGSGRARERVDRLVRRLEERGHHVEVAWTERPGDARRAAAECDDAIERIVTAGGDGTLNEVLNGLRDPSRVPLVPLALGTANMLAHELELPTRPEALADLAAAGDVQLADLGRIDRERFLLVASCGFDAMVTRVVRQRRRGALGYRGYAVPILRTVTGYDPPRLRVVVDEHEMLEGALVLVCNVRNYGGLFIVAERARIDSGTLEVVVFRTASVADIARFALAARLGRVSGLPEAQIRTAGRVRIESDAPVAVQVDGDPRGATPVEISIDPGCARLIVPPRS